MTSVNAVSQSMSYAQILAGAQRAAQGNPASTSGTGSGSSSATTVTLSDAARAALAGKDFATVTADARATMDALLAAAKLTSPLADDGSLALDLGKVDRRELFAIGTNADQQFTADEQKSAGIELQRRFDQALAGPTAVGRVTGSVKGLYEAALAYFDAMGPEEKASAAYADQRAAIETMLDKLAADPSTAPGSVPNDPVDAYIQRLAEGETGELRDIADVATDARTTLDTQYKASGTSRPDYSAFDSRSLAAVALNSGDQFSATEVRIASAEIRTRGGAALLQGLKSAGSSTDPTAFASNVISLYGAMSSEERAAAGWSESLYAAAVASYQTASKLGSLLTSATGSSLFGSSESGAGTGTSMSLLDYL